MFRSWTTSYLLQGPVSTKYSLYQILVDTKLIWRSPTSAGGWLPRTSSYERQSQWYASRGGWLKIGSDQCSGMVWSVLSHRKHEKPARLFLVRHVVSSTWWMQMTNPSWRTHCWGMQCCFCRQNSSIILNRESRLMSPDVWPGCGRALLRAPDQ